MKKEPVILVVDDEEEARRWVHEALEDQYRLIDAPGGKDALSELNLRGDISAIILDLVMPGVDGFDVLSELIKTPEHAAVPVFVLTNQKEEIFEANALKLGAMDYATKGIRKDVFRLRLANLLKRTASPPGPVQESYDDLTGFFKRNPFYQKVAERMEVGDREYDLLAMDISHFSLINAQYGMKEGDRLLSWIAEVVRKEFGKDLICGPVHLPDGKEGLRIQAGAVLGAGPLRLSAGDGHPGQIRHLRDHGSHPGRGEDVRMCLLRRQHGKGSFQSGIRILQ